MAKWITTRSAFLAAAMSVAMQAQAAAPDDAALLEQLPAGSSLESRLDADIDGDGIADVAFVGGVDDTRWLVVGIGRKSGGFEPASIDRRLDHPLGPASLSVKKNVLLVEDLTGGTSASISSSGFGVSSMYTGSDFRTVRSGLV